MKVRKNRTSFGAKKIEIDGIKFASKVEAKCYLRLKDLLKLGIIENLAVHRRIKLVVNGVRVCWAEPDFMYVETATGKQIVLEVKGYTKVKNKKTGKVTARGDNVWRVFKLKWLLMQSINPDWIFDIVTAPEEIRLLSGS